MIFNGVNDKQLKNINADTVDGYHASDFTKGIAPYFASGETILDWASNPNGVYKKFAVAHIGYPSDAPAQVEGFAVILSDTAQRKNVLFLPYQSTKVYWRRIWNNAWATNWLDMTNFLPLTGGTVTGTTSFSSGIHITNGSGDEGGEIILGKPETNTAFEGDVKLDVFQNAVRIFSAHNGITKVFNINFDDITGSHTAIHSGNVIGASVVRGTYTGNGDATSRAVKTGGKNNVAFIVGSNGALSIISNANAICSSSSGSVSTLAFEKIHVTDGTITIATDDSRVNGNGVTYTYYHL